MAAWPLCVLTRPPLLPPALPPSAGGYNKTDKCHDMFAMLDPRQGDWQLLPALPEARAAHASVAVDGQVGPAGRELVAVHSVWDAALLCCTALCPCQPCSQESKASCMWD